MREIKFRLVKNNKIVSTQELKPNGIIDCPVEQTENSIEEIFNKSRVVRDGFFSYEIAQLKQQLITFLLNHKGKPRKKCPFPFPTKEEFLAYKNGGNKKEDDGFNQSNKEWEDWLRSL
jgi:hypothetical protein